MDEEVRRLAKEYTTAKQDYDAACEEVKKANSKREQAQTIMSKHEKRLSQLVGANVTERHILVGDNIVVHILYKDTLVHVRTINLT